MVRQGRTRQGVTGYSMGGGFAPRNNVTQQGVLPGYNNPLDQDGNKWNLWGHPQPVARLGSTPGLMEYNRAPGVTAFGVIRRMWRQSINDIGSSPYSWLSMGIGAYGRPVGITRALRYLCSSLYMQAGCDNTSFRVAHTAIIAGTRQPAVTLGSGTMAGRPVIRNRMTSFGSRVQPLNTKVSAAQATDQG